MALHKIFMVISKHTKELEKCESDSDLFKKVKKLDLRSLLVQRLYKLSVIIPRPQTR
jgi:hypothetical protein